MPQSEIMYMQYIHSVYTTTSFGMQYGHARVMGWDDGTEEDAKKAHHERAGGRRRQKRGIRRRGVCISP